MTIPNQSDAQNSAHDKLNKIRLILDYLNKKCLSMPMTEYMYLKEQMCAHKATDCLEMYIKDEPHKWGINFLCY